jgi:hypothetical protein
MTAMNRVFLLDGWHWLSAGDWPQPWPETGLLTTETVPSRTTNWVSCGPGATTRETSAGKQARQWIQFTFPYTISTTYDNWRMPTLKELASLYQWRQSRPATKPPAGSGFKCTPMIRLSCGWVWSSETSAIQAYIFNFHRGYQYSDRMVHKKAYRALAVRDID